MAQVAEVEVSKDGAVRVRRVFCAVDCGTVVNPDTVQAQIQSAIIFGVTAALYGEITIRAAVSSKPISTPTRCCA
jgi:isoquinoline 1-oxidoreductase beta subunit